MSFIFGKPQMPEPPKFIEPKVEAVPNFEDVKINELNDDDRFLMPIHYTLIAKK